MDAKDIVFGRTYRARKPAMVATGHYNDRIVRYVSLRDGIVQYDSPAVPLGRHFPKVSIEAFAAWAGEDVTDKLPPGEWQRHPNARF